MTEYRAVDGSALLDMKMLAYPEYSEREVAAVISSILRKLGHSEVTVHIEDIIDSPCVDFIESEDELSITYRHVTNG
jgi:hypothetical protein